MSTAHERRALTVPEAAELLGVSENAIRQRLARGTLERAPEDGGPVRVFVDVPGAGPTAEEAAAQARAEELAERVADLRASLEYERQRNLETEAQRAGDGVRLDDALAELAKARAERDAAREEAERTRAALLALSWGLRTAEDAPPLLEDKPPSRWRLPWRRDS